MTFQLILGLSMKNCSDIFSTLQIFCTKLFLNSGHPSKFCTLMPTYMSSQVQSSLKLQGHEAMVPLMQKSSPSWNTAFRYLFSLQCSCFLRWRASYYILINCMPLTILNNQILYFILSITRPLPCSSLVLGCITSSPVESIICIPNIISNYSFDSKWLVCVCAFFSSLFIKYTVGEYLLYCEGQILFYSSNKMFLY